MPYFLDLELADFHENAKDFTITEITVVMLFWPMAKDFLSLR